MSSVSDLRQFLNSSPTPFHAVKSIKRQLIDKDFKELRESQLWETMRGGKYYVTRGETSIVAWVQGESFPDHGAHIIGAHTDSPNLRLKPHPNINRNGYRQLGVEVYGGVLLGTWTDRDLSLAGRVFVESANGLKTYSLLCGQPLIRIPQLAIHLNREVNEKGLQLNRQKHLPPILTKSQNWETDDALKFWLAEELDLDGSKIRSWDLSLYDTQSAECWGPNLEFIASARLDNLFCCFTGLQALCKSRSAKPWTQVLVCYDHEEIGSQTTEGAHSSFLEFVIRRLAEQTESRQAYERAVANSILVSADMAHAVHPNYSEQHDPNHFPQMNEGPVIKRNSQGRYATSAKTEAWFEQICYKNNVPVQKFVMRTDLACGSTIGPITAARLGVETVDVGAAMLAMHSIRETCGSLDVDYLIKAFEAIYEEHLPITN